MRRLYLLRHAKSSWDDADLADFDRPLDARGEWILPMFAPWLDPGHPKPAEPGELRWFVTAPDGKEIEAPDAGEPRLTLSARLLDAAAARHILIAGPSKRAALDRALALGDPLQAPILAVLDGATVHYAD